MRLWSIRQEPGPRAYYAATRQVGVVQGEGQLDALEQYVYEKYLKGNHRQYAGYVVEIRNARNMGSRWRPTMQAQRDDPHDKGREWSVVVTLRNGTRNTHTIRLLAWRVPA